ncbi:MAG: hypothetical protein ACK59A_07870 [Cyanobacteriota bacterium]
MGSSLAAELMDRRHDTCYSVVSLWEVAIKASLGPVDFKVDPLALPRGLLRGWIPGASDPG